jgi:single-strand DNA-binding protein
MLIGFVEREPEMRFTASGDPVAAFSLGTSRSWITADGERHQATDEFLVLAWHELAESSRRQLSRGDWVFVEGRLQTRSFEDNAGEVAYRIEIVASDIIDLAKADPSPERRLDAEAGEEQE